MPGLPVAVFVNGQRYQGDVRSVPLRPDADIVIERGGVTPSPPTPFTWPPGQ